MIAQSLTAFHIVLYTLLTKSVNKVRQSYETFYQRTLWDRILLDLALCDGEGPVPLKDIAQRQQISLYYLEHLIAPLITAGMIRSLRGARGGIWLAKLPQEIKLSEVVKLLEGSIDPVDCVNNPGACPRSDSCVTRDIWNEVKEAMYGVLESKTLQDLVYMQKSKGEANMLAHGV